MTARPMTEGERLAETLRFIAPDNNEVCWYGGVTHAATAIREAADEIERLSSAVRGMREALEWFMAKEKHDFASLDHGELCDVLYEAFDAFRAALSVEEGKEQARGQGRSAPISTDTKGTTK